MKNTSFYNQLKIQFKRPLIICIFFLVILALYSTFTKIENNISIIPYIIFSITLICFFNVYIPWMLSYHKIKQTSFYESIISALILFLIIDPNQYIILTIIASISTLLIRILIRFKGLPVFNPACAGILFATLVGRAINQQTFISWWGVSFNPRFTSYSISVAVFLTLVFGIFLTFRIRKLKIFIFANIFSIILFILFELIINKISLNTLTHETIYNFLEGTFTFGTLIMLTEPKTSPIALKDQIIYSFAFSLCWIVFRTLNFDNEIILAIICANIYIFFIKSHILKSKKMLSHSNIIKNQYKTEV